MATVDAMGLRGVPRRQLRAASHAMVGAVALLTLLTMFLAPAARAAAAPVVSRQAASPASFVPDWDGHTDMTTFTYVLASRSTVVVRVLDARGRAIEVLERGTRAAGSHAVEWDARLAGDRIALPGRYSIRVDARPGVPTPAAARARTARATLAPAARAAAVTVQAAPVAVRGVRLSRPAIGRSGMVATSRALWELNAPGSVSVAIVDGAGRGIRTLRAGAAAAGPAGAAWDGRRDDGTPAADGDYALVVAAAGAGRPTSTTRVPIRVDRTLPTLRASRATRARSTGGRLVIPVTVVTSEAAMLTVRAGARSVRQRVAAGTRQVVIPAAELGITAGARARVVALAYAVADDAGNTALARGTVTVPAIGRAAPVQPAPPTPITPGPTPPVNPGARLPWPVGGVVTSEFGPRNGRPHTGLDIAVPTGTPIHPAAGGRVSFVGVYAGYGNLVIVEHPSGMRTYYAHMSRFGAFAEGATVAHTDVIGYVGCTGSCTGPHLHFETRIADTPRDPRAYLQPR
ncbi:MAG: peptidase [Thermoleophilia bacterium]|nr:peptidase [Thermoleophilia bacterium]